MSTERIVVDEKIADEFVAKFAARARELPVGDPATGAACYRPDDRERIRSAAQPHDR